MMKSLRHIQRNLGHLQGQYPGQCAEFQGPVFWKGRCVLSSGKLREVHHQSSFLSISRVFVNKKNMTCATLRTISRLLKTDIPNAWILEPLLPPLGLTGSGGPKLRSGACKSCGTRGDDSVSTEWSCVPGSSGESEDAVSGGCFISSCLGLSGDMAGDGLPIAASHFSTSQLRPSLPGGI